MVDYEKAVSLLEAYARYEERETIATESSKAIKRRDIVGLPPFRECKICNYIHFDSARDYTKLDVLLPCCQTPGDKRVVWPSLEIILVINTIKEQKLEERAQRNVAAVFVSTLLEMLLSRVITRIIKLETESADKLEERERLEKRLSKCNGRWQLIELYNTLKRVKLSDQILLAGYSEFMETWEAVAKLRNQIVHGSTVFSKEDEIPKIQRLVDEALPVFAAINNCLSEIVIMEEV